MNSTRSSNVFSKDVTLSMVKILAKQKNGLKICHINAQSLNNKIDEFRLTFEDSGVDIICVSETWFNANTPNSLISLHGFNVHRADRQRHGGGVAIYINNKLNSKIFKKSDPNGSVEFIFCEVLSVNNRILVGCVYRPNRSINFGDFFTMLETTTLSFNDIIISGDFNSNILSESILLDNMLPLGFSPTNSNIPTHHTQTSNTLLDLFFVSDSSRVLLYDQISAPAFSKHDLIFLTYKFEIQHSDQTISYRDFKNVNYITIEEMINEINWNQIYSMLSVDDKLNFLHRNIINIYDCSVPIKTRIVKAQSRPWFSKMIKDAIVIRDIAYSRWKRFRTSDLLTEYRAARSDVNRKIRMAKTEYYFRQFSSAVNSKQKWNTIRSIGIGKDVKDNNCHLDANFLNRSFSNIPSIPVNRNYYNFQQNFVNFVNEQFSFEFACVEQTEVLSCVLAVKSNSIGSDNIDPRFLRLIIPSILPYVTHIFNVIITTSTFPMMWKHARIVPIPKTNTEFRPIAILCFLSKVLEKLLHKQMSAHINSNSLMHENQSGFRPDHSCTSALIKVTESLRQNSENRNISFLVLLDHSKAFDMVHHSTLCSKLNVFFRFSSSAVNLIQSYLSGRSQSVFTKNNISDTLPVLRGVPQGSILGPLLFSTYINDLPQQLSYSEAHLYADDVQIYLSSSLSSISENIIRLNYDLSYIHDWATSNGLAINPKKSKCLVVHSRSFNSLNYNFDVAIKGVKIDIVSQTKNLGIILNRSLTWSNHINVAVGQAYSKLRTLWSSQPYTPLHIRVLLAKSYIMPGILYGCELFANCDSSSKRKLNVIFNNVIRYIYNLKRYDSVQQFSKSLYGISFDNLLKTKTLIFLHKIISKHIPLYLFRKVNFTRSNRARNIIPLTHRNHFSERHFFINSIRLWNSLPRNIQIISNAKEFKSQVYKHYNTRNEV